MNQDNKSDSQVAAGALMVVGTLGFLVKILALVLQSKP